MNRDYGKEIDELREQLARIERRGLEDANSDDAREFFSRAGFDVPVSGVNLRSSQHGAVVSELASRANAKGYTAGILEMRGLHQSSSGSAYVWDHDTDAMNVLESDEELVEKILSAIGDRTRLRMLREILRKPCSTADLVLSLRLPTTGKAYHHLNILLSADLISKDDAGLYHMRPHRVAGFMAAQWAALQTADAEYSSPNLDNLTTEALAITDRIDESSSSTT